LNKDLGFTDADRVENIRRVAEVARLMVDAGLVVLVSFISPFRSERRMARALVADGEFIEVFVDTPLDVAESRDPKGLYVKARRGELKNFTGVDSPYEVPEKPELRLDTTRLTAEDSAQEILRYMERMGIVGEHERGRRARPCVRSETVRSVLAKLVGRRRMLRCIDWDRSRRATYGFARRHPTRGRREQSRRGQRA